MEDEPIVKSENPRHHRLALPALVVFCLALYFTGLGIRPLWNQDEGMHAGTSMDMLRTGDWITPTVNGEVFFDKPALHNWLVAVSLRVLGPTEFAARLPNAIMGLATVVVLFVIGRRMFGPGPAFLGSVVLATSAQFFALSRTVMHDMTLTFCVTAGLGLFYVGASHDFRQRRWFISAAAVLGLAVLAKGPAGLILPGAVAFFYLVLRRELPRVWQMAPGWGIVIFLAVTAPWYIAVAAANPDFVSYFLVELNVGSFVSSESTHPAPFWYYVPVLAGTLIPWSLFLPVALWRSFRQRAADPRGETLFLLLWIGVYLVFFSMAVSKLATYILPMFPPAALLIGRLWHDFMCTRDPRLGRALGWSVLPAVSVFPALIAFRILDPNPDFLELYGLSLLLATLPLVVFATGVLWAGVLAYRGRPRGAFGTVTGSAVAMSGLILVIIAPALNPHQTSKRLVIEMDERVPPGESLTMLGKLRDTALFYTERRVRLLPDHDPSALEAYLATSRIAYCLVDAKRWVDWGSPGHALTRNGRDVLIANEAGLAATLPAPGGDSEHDTGSLAGREERAAGEALDPTLP